MGILVKLTRGIDRPGEESFLGFLGGKMGK